MGLLLMKLMILILKNQNTNFKKEVQDKINELALEANKMRFVDYEKEQEAIRLINDEVIYAQ